MTERVTLRPDEAADFLGVGVRTLQDWTAEGFIPSIKRGNIRLYGVDALRRWADEQSTYEEGKRGKAAAVGDRVGLSAGWGRPVGRGNARRQRTPRPIRIDRARGTEDAG